MPEQVTPSDLLPVRVTGEEFVRAYRDRDAGGDFEVGGIGFSIDPARPNPIADFWTVDYFAYGYPPYQSGFYFGLYGEMPSGLMAGESILGWRDGSACYAALCREIGRWSS